MTGAIIILSTAGSQAEAQTIARELVERRLAACVNIIAPVGSIYRWQDKVESATEWLLLVKTRAENFPSVRDAIKELHSYEVPECIALGIEDGSAGYLSWISENAIGG